MGRPQKTYDPDVVNRVIAAYVGGMTIREVQRATPGVKVQNILERHLTARRRAARRPRVGR